MGEVISLESIMADRFVDHAWDVWASWLFVVMWPTPASLHLFWAEVDQWESDRLRLNIVRRTAA